MRQSFLYGTLVLIVSGAVTKILGFVNRIVLSRMIGAEGMGLYQMVVPILYFFITVTTFGLPVAIAKKVAETEAAGDVRQTRRFLLLSLAVAGSLSLALCILLFGASHLIVRLLFTDQRAHIVFLASLPVIPIATISAVLRGYFQGRHNMSPTAYSQLTEQIVRLALVFVMTSAWMDRGIEYATAGAVASIIFGELCGFLYIFWQYRRASMRWTRSLARYSLLSSYRMNRESLKQLFQISLPVTLSRLVGSIAYVLEPMIVPFALVMAGYHIQEATSLYGQFAGLAVPLLLFPTFLTYSLSVSLVPAVSEAAFQKNGRMVHRRIYQAMRITLVIGAPCAVLLYVFAVPLCTLLYHDGRVGELLEFMAPFAVFLFFQSPLAAALQGLDLASVVLRNTLIGALVKTAAMFVFTSQPMFGIYGAVIALNIGITLVTLLHFFSLVKAIGFHLPFLDFLKIGVAMFAMGYVGSHLSEHWLQHLPQGQMVLVASIVSTLFYLVLLIAFRILGKQDVRRIPLIGEQLAPFFPRR